ncbi:Dsf2p [Sugiyamaella lignohabitans]|uniref:Dsf2p n=1 Tax=Sugiyamaella lignohabitans TaxID=796027 RepID=A0A167ERM0_9ASCO|nr:Dsf2p [Sugiyamaella lignohabitans]ANB14389.1 Dsf2p [Sugiyamaella lignohabitans]
MSLQDQQISGNTFTPNLSPLDLLEQQSRQLAHDLHSSKPTDRHKRNSADTIKGVSEPNNPAPERGHVVNRSIDTHSSRLSQNGDTMTEQVPDQVSQQQSPSRVRHKHMASDTSTISTASSYQPNSHSQYATPDSIASNNIKSYNAPLRPIQNFNQDTNQEWTPRSRASMSSLSSFGGGGGILDSFRLSALPSFDRQSVIDTEPSSDNLSDISRAGSLQTIRSVSGNVRTSFDPRMHIRTVDSGRDANPKNDIEDSESTSPDFGKTHAETNGEASSERPQLVSNKTFSHNIPSRPVILSAKSYHQSASTSMSPDSTVSTPPSSKSRPVSDASSYYSSTSRFSQSSIKAPAALFQQFSHPTTTNVAHKSRPTGYFFPEPTSRPAVGKHQPQPAKAGNGGLLIPPSIRKSPPPIQTRKTSNDSTNSRNLIPQSLLEKPFADMTVEDHVTIGIAYHESGDLREASYHWQHAAFKGDHTAMLLYGLSLRHGWGMRQNPTEAVQWLRKAMESTIAEGMFKDGDFHKSNVSKEGSEDSGKVKKAHIGLALYELGMSYLHSWGIEKDETMALKSFELAGQFGDADALCEAAALYMHNGPKGRKKDLMKAAKLYRKAGELGANMVGQSWVYKDKYMEDSKKDKKKK